MIMAGWLGDYYLWVKALHVISVIFWMAGLFIFPRYLVHHHSTTGEQAAAWVKRETQLRHIILSPASIAAWIFGLMLAAHWGFEGGWLWGKLLSVSALTAYHHGMVRLAKAFARGERPIAEKRLRLWNEFPALITIIEVILVIVKPF